MKINLKRSIIFGVLAVVCFAVSRLPATYIPEEWSSFAFGFSVPLLIGFIVSLVMYFKEAKQQNQ